MPFKRENIKFTVLTIGFVLMVLFGVAGVVAIAYAPRAGSHTPLYTALTGFVTILAGQILALIRIEQAHDRITATKHSVEGGVGVAAMASAAAAGTAMEVKKTLDQRQATEEAGFTPLQLRMIEEIVRRIRCNDDSNSDSTGRQPEGPQ